MFNLNKISSVLIALTLALISSHSVKALTADEIQAQIDERNAAVKALEAEIAEEQKLIDQTAADSKSLQNTLKILDTERKKFLAQIKVTETKITSANLLISQLGSDIASKEKVIGSDKESIGSVIRQINVLESNSVIENMLNYESASEIWNSIDELSRLNGAVAEKIEELKATKTELEKNKTENETQKRELVSLKSDLSDRKKIVEYNQSEKDKLLKETKNKESNYKKILADKLARQEALEREILSFEADLKFAIDPKSLPAPGSGVLKWPLDFVKITQYFGKTAFADAHPQLYNGAGHNGIDLKASVGASVKAALSGKVLGVGNTDTVCPGASYGKWILIEHGNGLSTLYAHLSVFKVGEGDNVETGQVIGYSGDTGYATGPHLHFTVYASQGVKIMSRKSKVCSGVYTMPLADLKAYLNPLSYL